MRRPNVKSKVHTRGSPTQTAEKEQQFHLVVVVGIIVPTNDSLACVFLPFLSNLNSLKVAIRGRVHRIFTRPSFH